MSIYNYIFACIEREREIDTWDQIGISIYPHLPVWPLIERERPSGIFRRYFQKWWLHVLRVPTTLALLGCYFWFLSHQQFPMVSPVHHTGWRYALAWNCWRLLRWLGEPEKCRVVKVCLGMVLWSFCTVFVPMFSNKWLNCETFPPNLKMFCLIGKAAPSSFVLRVVSRSSRSNQQNRGSPTHLLVSVLMVGNFAMFFGRFCWIAWLCKPFKRDEETIGN